MTANEYKILDLIREDVQEIKHKVDSLLKQINELTQTVTAHEVEINYLKRNHNSYIENSKLIQLAVERANFARKAFWVVLSVMVGLTIGQWLPKLIK